MTKGGIEVITQSLQDHPHCPHGPTLLFCRDFKGEKRNFYACAACRERKHCNFFVWEDEKEKVLTKSKADVWEQERKKFLGNINHRKKFLVMNQIQNLAYEKRIYCHTCSEFHIEHIGGNEMNHNLLKSISDYQLCHPSEILPPLEDTKKEAQYFFAKFSVKTIVNILVDLGYKNIICMGTPRIHEYVRSNCKNTNSVLLDIDKRFHNFFGPLEFCWYNMFNHHFFFNDAKTVFEDFLTSDKGTGICLIVDPPFGGRVEPIAYTLRTINEWYKKLNKVTNSLSIFWIFPYFMEPQILNSLPEFRMSDYKVEYDNHASFQDGPKGRKHGTPVRIFTNVKLRKIKLPEDNYRYCKLCNKWVSKDNNHCKECNSCTSKDGRTYVHCNLCKRCVKPTWSHCKNCERCTQNDHKCMTLTFTKQCFLCKKTGHKKSECTQIGVTALTKRKKIKKEQARKKKK